MDYYLFAYLLTYLLTYLHDLSNSTITGDTSNARVASDVNINIRGVYSFNGSVNITLALYVSLTAEMEMGQWVSDRLTHDDEITVQ